MEGVAEGIPVQMRLPGPEMELAFVGDPVVTEAAAVLKDVEAAAKIQPAGHGNGSLRARTQGRKPQAHSNVTCLFVRGMRSRGVRGVVRGRALAGEGCPFDGTSIVRRFVIIAVRGRKTSCRKDQEEAAEEPSILVSFGLSHW